MIFCKGSKKKNFTKKSFVAAGITLFCIFVLYMILLFVNIISDKVPGGSEEIKIPEAEIAVSAGDFAIPVEVRDPLEFGWEAFRPVSSEWTPEQKEFFREDPVKIINEINLGICDMKINKILEDIK